MPLGASRLNFFTKPQEVAAEQRTAKTLTANGNAQIDTAQSKFGGSSALFDGVNDWIAVTGNNSDFNVAVGEPRTFECWVYSDDINDSIDTIMSQRTTGVPTFGWRWEISNDDGTNGELRLILWDSSGNADIVYTSNAISATTWHHVAYVWDGVDNHSLYIDGVRGLSHTASDTEPADVELRIGNEFTDAGVRGWDGNIDEVRVSNIARYSGASFTAPTEPFVNDSNTLLLIHADGTDADTVFIDDNGDRAPLGVQAFGDAAISTTLAKFGSSSIGMDGINDYVKVINNGELDFGTGDFTIEWWQYLTALDRWTVDMRDGGTNGSKITMYSYPSDGSAADLYLYVNSANRITATGALSANVWQHIALSRSGTSTKLFVDGTQVGSTYTDTTNYNNDNLYIWENTGNTGNYNPPGYVDEFRISDTARYTGSFTPSTTAFENDANTLLLLHAEEGASGSTNIFDDNGASYISPSPTYRTDSYSADLELAVTFDKTTGFRDVSPEIRGSGSALSFTSGTTASLSTDSPKFTSPEYRFSYEGLNTGDALAYTLSSSITNSDDFVIEFWANAQNATTNGNWTISNADSPNSSNRLLFGVNTGGTIEYQSGNGNLLGIGSGWHHIAIVNDGGTKRLYVDGIYELAWQAEGLSYTIPVLHVGQFNNSQINDFVGYLQDLRVYVGTNKGYTGTNSGSANFTLPGSIVESYS